MKSESRPELTSIILMLPALSFLYVIHLNILGLPTNVFELVVYAVAAAVFMQNQPWRRLDQDKKLKFALGITFAATVVACVISPNLRVALGIVKGWAIPALLATWMFRSVFSRHGAIDAALTYFKSTAVGLSLIALVQQIPYVAHLWSDKVPDVAQYLENHRSVAFYNSPNSLAVVLAFGLMVSLYLSFNKTIMLSSVIILAGLISTGSRAGIVAALIGIIIYYLWQKKQQLGAMAAFIASIVIFNPITLSIIALRNPHQADIRVEIWKSSWELLTKKPIFGYGLTSFQDAFSALTLHRVNYDEFITPYAVQPHNIFLYTWFLFGILGLVALVYLLVRAFSYLYPQNSKLAALAASLLAITVIHGMVDNSLWKNDLIVLFAMIFALVNVSRLNLTKA